MLLVSLSESFATMLRLASAADSAMAKAQVDLSPEVWLETVSKDLATAVKTAVASSGSPVEELRKPLITLIDLAISAQLASSDI